MTIAYMELEVQAHRGSVSAVSAVLSPCRPPHSIHREFLDELASRLGASPCRNDRVITREALIQAVYGFDDELESNTLEAQLSRLRKKLVAFGGNVEIRSMRGIGYIL